VVNPSFFAWKTMAGAVALPRPLAGSSVLELGAGPGLPGLAAAKMGARFLWEQEELDLFNI
jgi:predicted nicotinamide N-methyase